MAPNFALFHANLGNALIEAGRPDEARKEFCRVVELDPNDADACERLGVLLAKRGQLDEAIAKFRRSLEINSQNADACYDLGKALLRRGRKDEARQLFGRPRKSSPTTWSFTTISAWRWRIAANSMRRSRTSSGRWMAIPSAARPA